VRALAAGALLTCVFSGFPARAQAVTVSVDPTQDVRPISPLVYGMNFPSAAQLSQGKIPLMRWGGNATTRYNYQIDVYNTASDYFFENIPECNSNGASCSGDR